MEEFLSEQTAKGEVKPALALREEKRIDRFRALLTIAGLWQSYEKYHFSLSPGNLYYDRNFNVFVNEKEDYPPGFQGEKEAFIKEYKAVIAGFLQKKYTYEDYAQGGEDLYGKNKLLNSLQKLQTIEEITQWLRDLFGEEEEKVFHKKVEVGTGWYRTHVWIELILLLLFITAGGFLLYLTLLLLPRTEAMLQAQNSFLEGKYIQVIDDLEGVDLKYLDNRLKYILAVSYIKGENLTPEQKENVLEEITINGEEKLKDYWIYLGRLNTTEAANIAMQRSDDELLLYAYMTEKAVLEKNTEISGEEKASRLADLEKRIEELAKPYETKEE
ncbi:MAG: type VII secretion protein EssB/YukC [Lachnospiraceae bacterium]